RLLFFLPVILSAQAPATKAPTASPQAATEKPPAARPAAAAKPAAPKPAAAAKPQPPAPPPLATDEDKTIYALGLSMARSLSQFDLSPAELEIIKRALVDSAAGKPAVELSEWGPKIQPFAASRASRVTE